MEGDIKDQACVCNARETGLHRKERTRPGRHFMDAETVRRLDKRCWTKEFASQKIQSQAYKYKSKVYILSNDHDATSR